MIEILIVEDNITLNNLLVRTLSAFYSVTGVLSARDAIAFIRDNNVDVVISDVKLPDMSGIEMMELIKKGNDEIYFIFITGYGTVEEAVAAIKKGALDYMLKPVEPEALKAKIDIIANNINLKKLIQKGNGNLIYGSKCMNDIMEMCIKVAQTDSTVLISGETGVGKGELAKFIHSKSRRKNSKFFEINCANFVENLIESELFGYKKGAFTGASSNKVGLLKICDGGTLFMDEIAEIPFSFQSKLLKFIEDKRFIPVGSTEYETTDVRLVVATNRDLEKLVMEGSFRKDLFFRLNVITIHIPPLRERKNDIPLLVMHFIKKFKYINPFVHGITDEALKKLLEYDYPGNIRELSNIIERGMILEKGELLSPSSIRLMCNKENDEVFNLDEVIKVQILKVINICKGDKKKAANMLGIDRSTLYRKLKEYGIDV